MSHDGKAQTHVPAVFGMNFQAVSVGEKLCREYPRSRRPAAMPDALGTPSSALLGEIEFVDAMIGRDGPAELKAKDKLHGPR